jgi:hypothetical protein
MKAGCLFRIVVAYTNAFAPDAISVANMKG